jgi:hypothetical protein
MNRILNVSLGCLLISFLSCTALFAQSTAQISGNVKDQTGAVLPGADVSVTQTDTGINRTAVTDETGSFVLPNLATGPYRVEVSLPGFRTFVQTGVVLQVNSNPSINAVLQIGQVSDQIEVQANAAMVETRNVGVGNVIENERILELPLNGRNAVDLVVLSGAAVQTGTSTNYSNLRGGVSISVAGGPSFGTSYLLDGAMHNNPYDSNNLPLPFPDALQEFKVETGGLSAQNGLHSGAAVNAVTRSGTNELHGSLFEFVRNYKFNARNPFAPARDSLKRNQFGGTIGGPIKQNKVFFFAAYQGTITRQDPSDTQSFVPTAQMLMGDFTTVTSPQCRSTGQLNLRSLPGVTFVDNRIDPAQFSKAALAIAAKLPKTTDPCGKINWGIRTISNDHNPLGRIDYQHSDKQSIFGRLMILPSTDPNSYDPNNILTQQAFGRRQLGQLYTIGDTYLISPTTINSFRVAVNRTAIHRTSPEVFSPSDVGIANTYTGVPGYTIITVSNGGFSLGCGTCVNAFFRTNTFQASDDISLVRGSHQIGFGVNAARWYVSQNANVRSAPAFTFDGGTAGTGLSLADFLTGKVSSFTQAMPNDYYMRQWYLGAYVQDAWKATPKLTLNYGLRWEPFFTLQMANGFIYNFDYSRFTQGVKSTQYKNAPAGFYYPGDPGFPMKSGMNRHWKIFQPRIGLAWDVSGDGRTSVRASYGIAYDFVNGQYHLNTAIAPPWGSQVTTTNPVGGLDNPWQGYPGGNPYPITYDANAPFVLNGPFITTPYDLKPTYVQSWNVSLQKQLSSNLLFSTSYIGTRAVHLWLTRMANPGIYFSNGTSSCILPNGSTITGTAATSTAAAQCSTTNNLPQRRRLTLERPADGQFIGTLDEFEDGGTSDYHGLLLSVQRRVPNGLTLSGNYTWSHCIGDNANGGGAPNVNTAYQYINDRSLDRGNCASDRRHNVNLTAVARTPQFANPTLKMIATGWSLSGLYRIASGSYLTVTSGSDRALNGNGSQRAVQVLEDPYGDKTVAKYLNPAAFAQPALGTLSTLAPRNILGPSNWQFDMALSRSFAIAEGQKMDFRLESFNVTNSLRKGNPTTALNSNTFGQITSSSDARVMQFALKYAF